MISNQVRFGCGYRTIEGKRQYFAWHYYPDRNSDYLTASEIEKKPGAGDTLVRTFVMFFEYGPTDRVTRYNRVKNNSH